ncbi:hypothetical protein V1511DRAFT_500870 [Dipodascopsis uninucleata]
MSLKLCRRIGSGTGYQFWLTNLNRYANLLATVNIRLVSSVPHGQNDIDRDNRLNSNLPVIESQNAVPTSNISGKAPSYTRLTFEAPRLPSFNGNDNNGGGGADHEKDGSSKWRPHLKIILGTAGFIWTVWVVKTFVIGDQEDPGDKEDAPILDPNMFTGFIVTHREEVGRDCVLLELSPPWQKVRHWQGRHRSKPPEQDPRDPPLSGDPGVAGIWDGSRIWSVEVRQPDLQVVRKYTPLPLYFFLGLKPVVEQKGNDMNFNTDLKDNSAMIENAKGRPQDYKLVRTSLLKMLGNDINEDECKIVLLVRRYNDGEVSRWLYNRSVGSRIQLRGPFIECSLPKEVQPRSLTDFKRRYREHKSEDTPPLRVPMIDRPSRLRPDFRPYAKDMVFYAGGTGIASALQVLLSKNPIPGKMILHYSVRDRNDIVFPRFLNFLEKTGRLELHLHIDSEPKTILRENDVQCLWTEEDEKKWKKSTKNTLETWDLEQYKNAIELYNARMKYHRGKITTKPRYTVVSGPEGFIEYVAGKRADVSTLNTSISSSSANTADVQNEQGKVGGLLKKKGWDEDHVYKL